MSYESKKLKIVVGMGCIGLFLLASLAYNLGGAKQQAKDVTIHEQLIAATRTMKTSLRACEEGLHKEDGSLGPDYYRDQNMALQESYERLQAIRDTVETQLDECKEKTQSFSLTKDTESSENYVLATKRIDSEIAELNNIITHIRNEKIQNRTSLRLKIRVFRQENKRLTKLLRQRQAEEEKEKKVLEEIKHKNDEASREQSIGERVEGDNREYTGRTKHLVKSIAQIDDKQRTELYRKYSEEDPEGDEPLRQGQVRRRRRVKEEDDEEPPMPPRRAARIEAMRRARAEAEARAKEEEEEPPVPPRRRGRRRLDN